MGAVTKERVEKCLNEASALVKDMIAQVDVLKSYDAPNMIKSFKEFRSSAKWMAESILNKEPDSVKVAQPEKKYVRIELAKSLPENMTAAKLSVEAEEMRECLQKNKK